MIDKCYASGLAMNEVPTSTKYSDKLIEINKLEEEEERYSD